MSAGIVVIVVNAASCLSVRVRLSLKSKAAVGLSLPPPSCIPRPHLLSPDGRRDTSPKPRLGTQGLSGDKGSHPFLSDDDDSSETNDRSFSPSDKELCAELLFDGARIVKALKNLLPILYSFFFK